MDRVAELSRLAKEIRGHHDECVAAGTVMQSAHERFQTEAMLCGAKLHQVKELVRHGEFVAWVEKHCGFTVRTAQNYMAKAKAKGDSHLERPRVFTLTSRIFLRVADKWAGWLRDRVPDRQALLAWPAEERDKAAQALQPAAELYAALRGPTPTPLEGISSAPQIAGG